MVVVEVGQRALAESVQHAINSITQQACDELESRSVAAGILRSAVAAAATALRAYIGETRDALELVHAGRWEQFEAAQAALISERSRRARP